MRAGLWLLLAMTSVAAANPQGGAVAFGSATISSEGKVMTINQSTDRAIINWQRFENTATETIRFQQPALSSVTLNRVVGIDPSVISGALQSNGQLFLINPNGIVFDANSRINVGGLVASTLNITDDDFRNNRLLFVQTPGVELSSVINRGTITAQPGQTVALLAPIVDNSGRIVAAAGRVVINAATAASVDGTVVPPTEPAGGRPVRMAAVGLTPLLEDVVNTASVATANQVVRLDDGTVFLRGAGGIAVNGGEVDVNGTAANPRGGQVSIFAPRAIGLGPAARITALGHGESTGTVDVSPGPAGIATSRAGGATPARALVQAGELVSLQGLGHVRSDVGGGLELRAPRVGIGGARIGDPGAPVKIGGGATVNAVVTGDIDLAFAGDVTVELLFAIAGSIRIQSDANVRAGRASNSQVGILPEFVPVPPLPVPEPVPGDGGVPADPPGGPFLPPLPAPVLVIPDIDAFALGGSIRIDAAGDVGEPFSPFLLRADVGSAVVNTPGNQFVITATVNAFSAPVGAASDGLVDDLPVPRPRFTPPTDPIEAIVSPPATPIVPLPPPVSPAEPAPAARESAVGARDNVLLPALRGSYAKSDTAPRGDSSGGLIEVVRTPEGLTSDLLEAGSPESEDNRSAKSARK